MSLLHVSDTHLLGGDRSLFGVLNTEKKLEKLFRRVTDSGVSLSGIVVTGDLADLGEASAYEKLAELVNPWAQALEAEVAWVMGNHDDREAFSEVLMGQQRSSAPQDCVYYWGGLRLIVLDTTVPGYHHGELTAAQLAKLRQQLAEPAQHGTLIAMHHPPVPAPAELMGIIELSNQENFWEVVAGSDVRGILAGHLHHTTFTASHGIPVSVAPGMCYVVDLFGQKERLLVSSDHGQAVSLVSLYDDNTVFSHLPAEQMSEVHGFPAEFMTQIEAMTADERREMFSNKTSTFNLETNR